MWVHEVSSEDESLQKGNKLRNAKKSRQLEQGKQNRKIPANRTQEDRMDVALTRSESEEKDSTGWKGKKTWKKATKSKKTIEESLREIPEDMDELRLAAKLRVSAVEWLEDIDKIRSGSGNIQGGLSGHMRRRLNVLKEIVRIFMEKATEIGDPTYLRRRNQELSGDLRIAQQEIAKLKTTVKELQDIVTDLKANKKGVRDSEPKVDKGKSPPSVQQRLERAATEPISRAARRSFEGRRRIKKRKKL